MRISEIIRVPRNIIILILPYLMIIILLLTPFQESDRLYDGINSAKDFWFFAVTSCILVYLCFLIYHRPGTWHIHLNLTDLLFLVFYIWCFVSACFTPYTPVWHNHKLQVITGMLVVYFFTRSMAGGNFMAGFNNRIIQQDILLNPGNKFLFCRSSFILSFLVYMLILSGLIQAIYGILQLYGISPGNHLLYKTTGSFFNPAPYALYLAVIFPLALSKMLSSKPAKATGSIGHTDNTTYIDSKIMMLRHAGKIISYYIQSTLLSLPYYLSAITVIAVLLIIPSTMNRASWIGIISSGFLVLQYHYNITGRIFQVFDTRTKKLFAGAGIILIMATAGLALFYLKAGSSNGRLLIWEVATGKILERPLTGYGLGRFKAEYNNWQADYFMARPDKMNGVKGLVAGNTKYTFNEYIEMASEIGITGVLLFLAAIISCLGLSNRRTRYLVPSLTTILICALISFPLYSLPTQVLFFIFSGIISGLGKKSLFKIKVHGVGRFAVLIIILVLASYMASGLLKIQEYKAWKRAFLMYTSGNYEEASQLYEDCQSTLKYESVFLQMYGKSLQMAGRDSAALGVLKIALNLTTDQVLYTTLGDVCKSLQMINEAEKSYEYAAFMQPHTLYPHYLLARLYEETGQDDKALAKAYEVIAKQPKVESPAVDEIKAGMEELIRKLEF